MKLFELVKWSGVRDLQAAGVCLVNDVPVIVVKDRPQQAINTLCSHASCLRPKEHFRPVVVWSPISFLFITFLPPSFPPGYYTETRPKQVIQAITLSEGSSTPCTLVDIAIFVVSICGQSVLRCYMDNRTKMTTTVYWWVPPQQCAPTFIEKCRREMVDLSLFSKVDCMSALRRVGKEAQQREFIQQGCFFSVAPRFSPLVLVLVDVEEFQVTYRASKASPRSQSSSEMCLNIEICKVRRKSGF